MFCKDDNIQRREELEKNLQKSADQGDSWAQCQLGYSLLGIECAPFSAKTDGYCFFYELQVKKAIYWFRKAAEQGNAIAQNNLAFCYQKGYGVETNQEKAVEWFIKAVKQDEPSAECNLGDCYRYGIGVHCDISYAIQLYTKSANKGNIIAQCSLGDIFSSEQEYQKAAKWYQKAAEQGDLDAQCALAFIYEKYLMPSQMSSYWYLRAAEQKDIWSQYKVGESYYYGYNIEKNYVQALKWLCRSIEQVENTHVQYEFDYRHETDRFEHYKPFEKNIKQLLYSAGVGDALSQYIIGECYFNGTGLEQNVTEAVKWYKRSAEQNNIRSLEKLCTCDELTSNPAETVKWYRKLAMMGFPKGSKDSLYTTKFKNMYGDDIQYTLQVDDAIMWLNKKACSGSNVEQLILAEYYYRGIGVSRNIEEAIKWYLPNAKQGDAETQYKLGVCYGGNSGGNEINAKESVKWLEKAAMQGNASAEYALGLYYERCESYEEKEKALGWYFKAAAKGNTDAQYAIGRCYDRGIGVIWNHSEAVRWYETAYWNGNEVARDYFSESNSHNGFSRREIAEMYGDAFEGDSDAVWNID